MSIPFKQRRIKPHYLNYSEVTIFPFMYIVCYLVVILPRFKLPETEAY